MNLTAFRALCAGVLLTCLFSTAAAFAHAHLKQQSPAANAQVTTVPQALTLSFSEGIEVKFSGITVTGPQQAKVPLGAVKLNEKDSKELIVPVEQSLKPGDYTVDWHVVSVDGHKTQGQYHFSVK
ncbi:CopC domain-containing protein YobA [Enterobacter asburiae]|uniref:CopC domain-containing protein YobA n=1 Tax=Scandinavium sp. UTDF21-P1B TaxID=3446379 RepID=UPI003481F426